MSAEPLRLQSAPEAQPRPKARKPGISRARHLQELARGNVNALRHGARAEVLIRPEVDTEVALQFAMRPGLDRFLDARLVEEFAISLARRARVQLAMDAGEGHSSVLTAYDSKLAPLIERLERTIHEREQLRIRQAAGRGGDLSRYRSGAGGS